MRKYKQINDWEKLPELGLLKEVKPRPKTLYYLGDWSSNVFENCVAVVGSRRMTNYGKTVVEKLVLELVDCGRTIVSGFMYGVDQYAHEQTIEFGGKTVAVLGQGITWGMDGKDRILADKIIESGGLILSEWEKQMPTRWTFPLRNRIVAGLCRELFVVEATEKSGSIITVSKMEVLGRKVWAVPGPITSRVSMGTNKLIYEGRAEAWLGAKAAAKKTGKENESEILKILVNEELTVDELSRKLRKSVEEVGAELLVLLLKGDVKERGGKYKSNN